MVSKIGEGEGGAVFRVNKLCGRCEYTNVDPETGTKVPRGEVHKVSHRVSGGTYWRTEVGLASISCFVVFYAFQ